jgi:hypothetical protein
VAQETPGDAHPNNNPGLAPQPELSSFNNTFLIEKYRAASASANQSRQERTTLYNMYLVAAGGSAAVIGLILGQLNDRPTLIYRSQLLLTLTVALVAASCISVVIFNRLRALGREYYAAQMDMASIERHFLKPSESSDTQARTHKVPTSAELSGRLMLWLIALVGSLLIGLLAFYLESALSFLLLSQFGIALPWAFLSESEQTVFVLVFAGFAFLLHALVLTVPTRYTWYLLLVSLLKRRRTRKAM